MAENASQGRYTTLGEVARGGMGVVLRVKDRNLDRMLAMKRMLAPPDAAGDDAEVARYARFLGEAQITAQLDHPSIVPIHELGTDEEGRTYYTMRLVKGREFGEVVREVHGRSPGVQPGTPPASSPLRDVSSTAAPRWNLQRAIGVLVRVCQTMVYAHGKGVVHRDLKPANIMVGDLGEVYVMDWGLAKMAGHEDLQDLRLRVSDGGGSPPVALSPPRAAASLDLPLITMSGAVLGTPAYMSPEQARGDIGQVDALSDIYSLGAILYELLAGHPPYQAEGTSPNAHVVLEAIRREPPATLKIVALGADAELVAIGEKAMCRERSGRYTSCLEMAEDLQAFLDGRVVRAHRTGPMVEARKWVQRNRATAIVGAAALAIGVGALVVIEVMQSLANTRLTKAYTEQKEAAERESLAKRDVLNTLAESYAQQGYTAARDGNAALAALWFEQAARTATNSPGIRAVHQFRAAAWSRRSALLWRALVLPVTEARRMQFDRTQRFLAVHDLAGGSFVVDLERERTLKFGGGRDKLDAVALHPTKAWAAVWAESGRVRVYNLTNAVLLEEVDLGETAGPVRTLAFSADGRLLFLGGRTSRIWDFERRSFWPVSMTHPKPPTLALFSQDNAFVITSTRETRTTDALRVFPLGGSAERSGEIEPAFASVTNDCTWIPTFAAGGRQFYHADPSLRPVLRDTRSGEVIWRSGRGWVLQLGPDQRQVYGDYGGGVDTAAPEAIAPDPALIAGRFSPKGDWVAVGKGPIHLASTRAHDQALPLAGHFNQIEDCTFSPDGELFVASESYGLIRVWKLPAPSPVRPIDRLLLPGDEVAFHPREPIAVRAGSGTIDPNTRQRNMSPAGSRAEPFDYITGEASGPGVETGGRLLDAAFSPTGEALVTASVTSLPMPISEPLPFNEQAGNVQVWDWRDGRRSLGPVAMPAEPCAVAFHPSGEWLAVLCLGGEVLRVDVANGGARLLFEASQGNEPATLWSRGVIRFAHDGQWLVVLRRTLQTWDVAAGRLLAESPVLHGGIKGWDITGDTAVAALDQNVHFIHLQTGKPAAPRQNHRPMAVSVQFSDDGRRCLTASDTGARYWDWQSGQVIAAEIGTGKLQDARLLPATPWALTISSHRTNYVLEFWEAATGQPAAPRIDLGWHGQRFWLSPDGRHGLASDGTRLATVDFSRTLASAASALDQEQSLLLAEINSGARIVAGGLLKLSREEWVERWRRFRGKHPVNP